MKKITPVLFLFVFILGCNKTDNPSPSQATSVIVSGKAESIVVLDKDNELKRWTTADLVQLDGGGHFWKGKDGVNTYTLTGVTSTTGDPKSMYVTVLGEWTKVDLFFDGKKRTSFIKSDRVIEIMME